MNRLSTFAVTATVITAAAALLVGCGSKQKTTEAPARTKTSVPSKGSAKSDSVSSRAVHDDGRTVELAAIYFELDSDALTQQARETLTGNARYLERHGDVTVQIEGHCDERGTTEYNIALGERRARVARDYLSKLGVSGARIDVISYGKERPVAHGSNEDAWAQNRRGEFVSRAGKAR
jgi:peptidoglycan-associated lipoprotein